MALTNIKLFFKSDVEQKILTVALNIGLVALFVSCISIFKELVSAYYFGTNSDMDAFVLAFAIPSFAINVIAGSFNAATIPTYIQVLAQNGRSAGQDFFASISLISIFVLVIFSLILGLTAKIFIPIIGSGFNTAKLHLTYSLFFLMLPVLCLTGIASLWTALLNAEEHFRLPALRPAITPIIIILFLVLFSHRFGITVLAIGTTLGALMEVIYLGVILKLQDINILPYWSKLTPGIQQSLKQFGPMILATFIGCSSTLIDQAMAGSLVSSSNSALNYGIKLTALPLTLIVTALGSAVIPFASKMATQQDWQALRKTCKYYLKLIFSGSIIFMIFFAPLAKYIVAILFQRGAFTHADTILVTHILLLLLLQTPFYVGGVFISRLLSAIHKNQILMWCVCITVITNFALNYLLMHWIGVKGIALATSIVYLISFCYLWFMFNKQIRLKIQSA